MTVLEATVEITKAAISSVGGASESSSRDILITVKESRKEFLEGIDALYRKLLELEKNNKGD